MHSNNEIAINIRLSGVALEFVERGSFYNIRAEFANLLYQMHYNFFFANTLITKIMLKRSVIL